MAPRGYAVIMAGGRGERFWPLSTTKHPKQVITLVGDKPMLALAVDYVRNVVPPERVIVITSADLIDSVAHAVPELERRNIIGEPFGRDTAAVCALATAVVKARDPEGVVCILTADHIIQDNEVFENTLRESIALAAAGDVLITIGIRPSFPSTGFGYIEAGDPLRHEGRVEFMHARRFVEKPDASTAAGYVASGRFFWNAGMFAWSVASFERAMAAHRPVLAGMAERMAACVDTPSFDAQLRQEYGKLERISVDYAIMEKARNIVMAKGVFRWDDVGSWPALANHFPADAAGNVIVGRCEHVDSSGNIVVSRDRLTALIGVRDVVVVQADGVTLVCARDRAQDVKKLVQQLAERPGGMDFI